MTMAAHGAKRPRLRDLIDCREAWELIHGGPDSEASSTREPRRRCLELAIGWEAFVA